jgi:glutaredoxin
MKKIYKIIIIVLAALALLLVWGHYESKKQSVDSAPTLFYGDGCPHCAVVEKYIADNNIKSKLTFRELEVFNNKTNAALMAEKAQVCKLDTSGGLGVPFFFTGTTCLVGDQDIDNYFSQLK